jgi:ribosome recycling factor
VVEARRSWIAPFDNEAIADTKKLVNAASLPFSAVKSHRSAMH